MPQTGSVVIASPRYFENFSAVLTPSKNPSVRGEMQMADCVRLASIPIHPLPFP